MSEIPAGTDGSTDAPVQPEQSGLRGLLYAVYAAMSVDMGCIIGAVVFIALIAASAIFSAAITPCTSAGGIPCAH